MAVSTRLIVIISLCVAVFLCIVAIVFLLRYLKRNSSATVSHAENGLLGTAAGSRSRRRDREAANDELDNGLLLNRSSFSSHSGVGSARSLKTLQRMPVPFHSLADKNDSPQLHDGANLLGYPLMDGDLGEDTRGLFQDDSALLAEQSHKHGASKKQHRSHYSLVNENGIEETTLLLGSTAPEAATPRHSPHRDNLKKRASQSIVSPRLLHQLRRLDRPEDQFYIVVTQAEPGFIVCEPRLITFPYVKGFVGLGLTLSGSNPVRIARIDEGSPADFSEAVLGDCLLEINGHFCAEDSHLRVITLMTTELNLMRLVSVDKQEVSLREHLGPTDQYEIPRGGTNQRARGKLGGHNASNYGKQAIVDLGPQQPGAGNTNDEDDDDDNDEAAIVFGFSADEGSERGGRSGAGSRQSVDLDVDLNFRAVSPVSVAESVQKRAYKMQRTATEMMAQGDFAAAERLLDQALRALETEGSENKLLASNSDHESHTSGSSVSLKKDTKYRRKRRRRHSSSTRDAADSNGEASKDDTCQQDIGPRLATNPSSVIGLQARMNAARSNAAHRHSKKGGSNREGTRASGQNRLHLKEEEGALGSGNVQFRDPWATSDGGSSSDSLHSPIRIRRHRESVSNKPSPLRSGRSQPHRASEATGKKRRSSSLHQDNGPSLASFLEHARPAQATRVSALKEGGEIQMIFKPLEATAPSYTQPGSSKSAHADKKKKKGKRRGSLGGVSSAPPKAFRPKPMIPTLMMEVGDTISTESFVPAMSSHVALQPSQHSLFKPAWPSKGHRRQQQQQSFYKDSRRIIQLPPSTARHGRSSSNAKRGHHGSGRVGYGEASTSKDKRSLPQGGKTSSTGHGPRGTLGTNPFATDPTVAGVEKAEGRTTAAADDEDSPTRRREARRQLAEKQRQIQAWMEEDPDNIV